MIVPVPVLSANVTRVGSTAPSNDASLNSTENVSSFSTNRSPRTSTTTVVVRVPAAMVAVCATIAFRSGAPTASIVSGTLTVAVKSLLAKPSDVMVNTYCVTPLSASICVTSSIVSVTESSLVIVPTPIASPMMTREGASEPSNLALESWTVNVSSISTKSSPTAFTLNVAEVSPALMMTV